jgi:hypothetical protein
VNGSADFGPNFVDGILVGEDAPLAVSETKKLARFTHKNKMVSLSRSESKQNILAGLLNKQVR